MIGALRGILARCEEDLLLVDVQGVGYEVTVSSDLISRLPAQGESISLIISTDMRENAITLYGFLTTVEREVFLLLKRVKGIGSKLALSILGAIRPEPLLVAIAQGDVSALHAVPGIGRKTAERIIVELREQMGELVQSGAAEEGKQRALHGQIERTQIRNDLNGLAPAAIDVLLALEKLGFPTARARSVLETTLSGTKDRAALLKDSGELLRVSLAALS